MACGDSANVMVGAQGAEGRVTTSNAIHQASKGRHTSHQGCGHMDRGEGHNLGHELSPS